MLFLVTSDHFFAHGLCMKYFIFIVSHKFFFFRPPFFRDGRVTGNNIGKLNPGFASCMLSDARKNKKQTCAYANT